MKNRRFGYEENLMSPIQNNKEKENKFKSHKNKQINKFLNHKKLFNIKENNFLKLFEDLLKNTEDFDLDCSCKIEKEQIFPCRFNINMGYGGKEKIKNINIVFNFLKNLNAIGAKMNYDLIKKIFDNKIDLDNIKEVLLGIDLREDKKNSRAKFWLVINKEDYKLLNLILELHGHNQKVIELINKNDLLFGFDFYFDGRTKIKIYPQFTEYELKDKLILNKMEKIFFTPIVSLISECHTLHISFQGKEFNRILHFHPNNLFVFLSKIKNKKLNNLVNSIDYPIRKCVISLKEEEINKNKIESFNFYY